MRILLPIDAAMAVLNRSKPPPWTVRASLESYGAAAAGGAGVAPIRATSASGSGYGRS